MWHSFDPSLPVGLLPPLSSDHSLDLKNLQSFLERALRPKLDAGFVDQIYVCIGIIAFLLVVSGALVLHRLVRRQAWLFKLWHVAGGTFVIPNAVVAFLVCEGCFGFVWIVHAIITLQHYRYSNFQANFFVWKTLIWTPLWTGSWWTSFGLLSAFPDALTLKSKQSKQKRLILSPMAFNIACWGVPLMQFGSILPLAIVDARDNAAVARNFAVWLDDVRIASQGVSSDATFAELHSRAIQLWIDMSKVYWVFAVIMACLTAWSLVALLAYVPIGAHVLIRVRTQLKLEQSRMEAAAGRPPAGQMEQGVHGVPDPQGVPRRSDCVDLSTSRVFPSMREPPTAQTDSFHKAKSPQERRVRNLKRLFKNLSAQYLGITVAILCFFFSAGEDAIRVYDAARRNDAVRVDNQSTMLSSWTMVIFASLTFFCIFRRSFDPSLSVDLAGEEPSPLAPRSVFVVFSKLFPGLSTKISPKDINARSTPVCPLSHVQCQDLVSRAASNSSSVHSNVYAETASKDEKYECDCLARATRTSADHLVVPNTSIITPKGPSNGTNRAYWGSVDAYYATPFGSIPAVTAPAPLRPLRDPTMPLLHEPGTSPCDSSPVKRFRSLQRPSVSSFGYKGERKSRSSSLSTGSTAVVSECVSHQFRYERAAHLQIVSPRKSESTPELAGRYSSSGVASRLRKERAKPLLDMEAKCFIPLRPLVTGDPGSNAIADGVGVSASSDKLIDQSSPSKSSAAAPSSKSPPPGTTDCHNMD